MQSYLYDRNENQLKLHDELANDVFYAMTFADTQDLQNPQKKKHY
jgi:hypothetical protein